MSILSQNIWSYKYISGHLFAVLVHVLPLELARILFIVINNFGKRLLALFCCSQMPQKYSSQNAYICAVILWQFVELRGLVWYKGRRWTYDDSFMRERKHITAIFVTRKRNYIAIFSHPYFTHTGEKPNQCNL